MDLTQTSNDTCDLKAVSCIKPIGLDIEHPRGTAEPHDQFGPGTRIPALFIVPGTRGDFSVDTTEYDTTSILTTIEHRYGLAPLGTRDAADNDFSNIFDAREFHAGK